MRNRPESSAVAFLGTLAFSILCLTQVVIGLALNRSWDTLSVIFAVMAVISGGLSVHFLMSMTRKIRERAARIKPQAAPTPSSFGLTQ